MTDGEELPGRSRVNYTPKPRNVETYVQQERIRTVHFGIGAIGAEIVRAALNNPSIEIVGAVDPHPAKAGRDLGEAAGIGRPIGVTVQYDAEALLKDVYADVVVHTTGSSLTEVFPQLMTIVSNEKSIVSSCEELSFPWIRHPDLSQRLDRRAKETGVRVLGTGVNPGFVMDLLPLMMLTVCQQVKSVRIERVVDVSKRRIQLQRKVGVGLSVKAFQAAASSGGLGHVGLRESLFMISDTLGWRLDDVKETIEPVVAPAKMNTEFFSVDKGYVAGLRQAAIGTVSNREIVRLDLEMSLGAKDPHDGIDIDAAPPLKVLIPGGIAGDIATASIMANCVPAVARNRAVGLLTMRDLPLLPYYQPQPQRGDAFE